MSKRAWRRHHRKRLLKKREKYWTTGWNSYFYGNEPPERKRVSRVVDTPKPCSCPACGNQRKHEGYTMQELRCSAFYDEN
jgi:hypothetical protein